MTKCYAVRVMRRTQMNNKWKYVVWVGGCDDYYTEYERAKEHYDEWIEQGYDDVHLLKLEENEHDS